MPDICDEREIIPSARSQTIYVKGYILTPLVEVSDRLVATGLSTERAGRVIVGLAERADHLWQKLLVDVATAIWRISMSFM